MSRIVQSEGIVIRRMNYRESSMIVDIFTESHGLSGFIVSGVRKSKPVISPVLFTPGYHLSLVYYEREPHQLWRIREASIARPLFRTPFDIIRGNTALCMCEVIRKTVLPYDVNPALFQFMSSYFQTLDSTEKSGNILLHFLVHLSVELGFGPRGESDSMSDALFFDIKSGEFQKEEPLHNLILTPEISSFLRKTLHVTLEESASIQMSRRCRQELTDGLIDYIRYHSHAAPEIKSYELLKKIW